VLDTVTLRWSSTGESGLPANGWEDEEVGISSVK
jgi:hypothetical protein